MPPLASGGLLALFSTPALQTHHPDLCLHVHVAFSLWVSLFPNFPLLTKTLTTALGPVLSQHDLILTLHLLRSFIQRRTHS